MTAVLVVALTPLWAVSAGAWAVVVAWAWATGQVRR